MTKATILPNFFVIGLKITRWRPKYVIFFVYEWLHFVLHGYSDCQYSYVQQCSLVTSKSKVQTTAACHWRRKTAAVISFFLYVCLRSVKIYLRKSRYSDVDEIFFVYSWIWGTKDFCILEKKIFRHFVFWIFFHLSIPCRMIWERLEIF